MPLTPQEEKKLREEIQKELEKRERTLQENKQKEEAERQRRLEQRMRERIREEEEEKYFTQKGYVKYINHQGLVEWLTPEEAERRRQKRRSKKSSSRHRKYQKKRLLRIIGNLGIAAFALIVLFILYKFNPSKEAKYGSIVVRSDVPGSQIYLDGQALHAFTPDTLRKISPGKHFLSVYKEGFTALPPMASISVTANKTGTVNFSLRNATFMGKVIIESNISDFELYVDGLLQKMTAPSIEIPIGYHVFSAVKAGYLATPSYQRTLVEQNKVKRVKFQFIPAVEIGYLQISSNRQNEYIYLDNKFTGLKATGRSFPVKAGTYEVSVRENGYVTTPNTKIINLVSEEKETVIFRSKPVDETQLIDIYTEKPGAAIIVNGNWMPFVTPVKELALSPGSHFINFMRGDSVYAQQELLVNLSQLKDNKLKLDF